MFRDQIDQIDRLLTLPQIITQINSGHWPNSSFGIGWITQQLLLHFLQEFGSEFVLDCIYNYEAFGSDAALSGIDQFAGYAMINSIIDICIFQNYIWITAPQF